MTLEQLKVQAYDAILQVKARQNTLQQLENMISNYKEPEQPTQQEQKLEEVKQEEVKATE